jgi:hypothetical protein
MVPANVVTQGAQDVRLKHFAIVAQPNEVGARYDADFASTQRDRIAAILAAANTIEAEEIPGHLKAGYLTEPVFGKYCRLEKSSTDRMNRIALRTGSIQNFVVRQAPAITDQRWCEQALVMRNTAQTNFPKPA